MVRKAHGTPGLMACIALALCGLLTAALLSAPAVGADLASAKAVVDAAKDQGIVGEQGDGYLGLVHGSASAAVTAAVDTINAGRAAVYRQTAAKAGVMPEAVAQAAAQQIAARLPAGQYYKPLGGSWMRK
jgi:uncharacterized protein